ncbi:hypothetical protein GCK32_001497 [Trichostrongylus colubriformis]|uniref:Uncharacterized protein n=1 Tax=Trichostrongylus colubriformis TaxID=6319 RepID=A0AAN8IFQ4_TRICO
MPRFSLHLLLCISATYVDCERHRRQLPQTLPSDELPQPPPYAWFPPYPLPSPCGCPPPFPLQPPSPYGCLPPLPPPPPPPPYYGYFPPLPPPPPPPPYYWYPTPNGCPPPPTLSQPPPPQVTTAQPSVTHQQQMSRPQSLNLVPQSSRGTNSQEISTHFPRGPPGSHPAPTPDEPPPGAPLPSASGERSLSTLPPHGKPFEPSDTLARPHGPPGSG